MHLSAIAALALAGAASADFSSNGLKILAPGGPNLWWLQDQLNNIAWTCAESTIQQFTVLINNSDVSLLTDIQAIVAQQNNFDCVEGLTANQVSMPIGDGYTIVFADIINGSHVYAVSDPFSIKAVSAGYPQTSATPVDSGSTTVVKPTGSDLATVGATGSGGSAPPQKTNAGMRLSVGGAAAVLGAAAAALSLF